MIDAIFIVSMMLTVVTFIISIATNVMGKTNTFLYSLFTSVILAIFSIIWAIQFGEY